MYSADLSKITLEDFENMMLSAQLLPSQRIILDDLSLNMQKLRNHGLKNLLEVQKLLKKKDRYPAISAEIGIDEDYLVILNRMVNSYVVKPLPLDKLGIFSKNELDRLAGESIKNTKQYYEALMTSGQREKLSDEIGIVLDRIEYALHIADLLRINGVGVEYAKILYKMGITCIDDYNSTPSKVILASFRELNREKAYSRSNIGISDIDYCRRFCQKLDNDIDW
ncbi:MAG: DUF4332 domain-containing protein [Methanolobus sp.]|nr:DUF4332 domain-containing protein [Methanolobus sp.]